MCPRDRVENVRLRDGDDSISVTSFTTRLSNSNNTTSSDDEGSLPQLWQGRQNRRDSAGIIMTDHDDRNRMLFIKVILILVLLGAVVGMSVGAFQYVRHQEKSTFETEFQNIAREVISLASKNIRNKFETTQLLAASLSSVVQASDSLVWPNVSIPNYGAKASLAWEAMQASTVVFAPIVQQDQRLSYEAYMREHIYENIQEMIDYRGLDANASNLVGVPDVIAALNISSGGKIPETRPGPYLVNWNYYPFNPDRFFTGNNLLALRTNRNAYASMMASKTASLSFANLVYGIRGQIFQPIFESVDSGKIVGVLWVTSFWANYFTGPKEARGGLEVVLRSSCGFTSTFAVNATGAVNLGLDDLHNYPQFDHLVVSDELFSIHASPDTEAVVDDACLDTLMLDVYPTQELRDSYMTQEPFLYAGIILIIFTVTLLLFLAYDRMVNQRQLKNRRRMQKQDRIVADIFPEQIMTRLYGNNGDEELDDSLDNTQFTNSDLSNKPTRNKSKKSMEPIADLYLESTILYSDICGFTAWSSQREPPQVFMLLEHIFCEFDKLARRFGVFKVESIGDVFIAATGVPDHDPSHALNMARFARKCIDRSSNLMKLLETKLGPDTADLEIRIGIHSGQVTAGVLRGDRARFQLFGDTVNTAEQLLKHGRGKMVHISEATANLLKAAGKSRWVVARSSSVVLANLKNTYWLKTTPILLKGRSSSLDLSASPSEPSQPFSMYQLQENDEDAEDEDPTSSHQDDDHPSGHFATDLLGGYEHASQLTKTQRLVAWNVQVLTEFLEQLMAARQIVAANSTAQSRTRSKRSLLMAEMSVGNCETVLDEFREIISLPDSSTTTNVLDRQRIAQTTVLPDSVKEKLRHLVASIASMYRANPFHNFEHASHVTASVVKMLKRITDTDVAAQKRNLSQIQNLYSNEEFPTSGERQQPSEQQPMAAHSYGITSDPLTQFAVVFCSIIHDADHPGVTNAVLVKEDTYLSRRYKQKSVAEQNSVDLVWSLLNLPEYAELRSYIYSTEDELRRFRQIIVNIVMATDIADKELGALRKNRWNVAFAQDAGAQDALKSDRDRKATIVLEHLIQASDVSHTMQHWNIYLLWNEKLFREMYRAYKDDRMDSDPTKGWYKGEIGFFDFYIIPLAKKLENCGVFGVSSAEYLEYAEQNRTLWEERGEAIVAGYLERLQKYPDEDNSSDLEAFNVEDLELTV